MKPIHAPIATLILSMVLAVCQEPPPQPIELPPPEVFTWTTGQPISFSPPPEGWRRSRYQNGGAEGTDFVLAGSGGEQIYVAERFFLGNRDRCATIKELLENLDGHDHSSFVRAMSKARLYAEEPYNVHEERTVEVANYTLEKATRAFSNGSTGTARTELVRALEQAATIRFTVDETVDRVLFTREKNSVYPALQVDGPAEGEVSGEPALVVNFTFQGHGAPMVGRRVYVVKNNRMFEFGFQGLQEHLALFEEILDSVTFPPGTCEH